MADTKVTDLGELTEPNQVDLLYVVDDPGGTPVGKKIAVENLLKLSFYGISPADMLPTGTSTWDDEFDDASLDAKWTEYNLGGLLSVSETSQPGALQLIAPAGGDFELRGWYQDNTFITGSFDVRCKVHCLNGNAGGTYASVGIGLWEGTGVNDDKVSFMKLAHNMGGRRNDVYTSDSGRSNIVDGTGATMPSPIQYLRIQKDGANWNYYVSHDGMTWWLHSTEIQRFIVAKVGIVAWNTSSKDMDGFFSWFRVT